jgi:asparagine synthase (glutamine-hydrolysing)
MVAGVRKLPPGHRMIVTPHGVRIEQYWDIPLDSPKRVFNGSDDPLKGALDHAVSSHLMSDVPVAAFLSGGIDSSIVVGAMVKAGAKPETFSAGFGDDPEYSELKYAKLVSDHWGLKNHQVMVGPDQLRESLPAVINALEEPIADPAAVPGYFLSQMAAGQFKVVLTGEGADEVFAGYKRYRWAQLRQGLLGPLSRLGSFPGRLAECLGFDFYRQRTAKLLTVPHPATAYLENVSLFSLAERKGLYGPALSDMLSECPYPAEPLAAFERANANDLMEQMLYTDSKCWLADDLLIKMDKVSMAHSLEARVPFLDHHFVEQAWQVSSDWKYRSSVSKYPLRMIGAEYLPPAIARRPKHGFDLPLARWLRGDLGSFARDAIMGSPLLSDGSLNRSVVESILDEHQQGGQDRSFQIFGLLTLALWEREYLR